MALIAGLGQRENRRHLIKEKKDKGRLKDTKVFNIYLDVCEKIKDEDLNKLKCTPYSYCTCTGLDRKDTISFSFLISFVYKF